jgi:gluconate 2-dehydrogenase gamma chain
MERKKQHFNFGETYDALPNPRRRFMFKSALLLPAAVSLGACEPQQSSSSTSPTGSSGSVSPPKNSHTPRYFNAEEWAFLRAAVAVLIPNDDNGPGALELDVPVFIDRQMESEFGHAARWYMQGPFRSASPLFGYQSRLTPREVYRLGIAATNEHCRQLEGKDFAALPFAVQDAVLHQLDEGALRFESVDAKSFFDFLRANTIEGYLADPIHGGNKGAASWKMIGFPGARADFLEFVGQNKPYPYGPVGISGEES